MTLAIDIIYFRIYSICNNTCCSTFYISQFSWVCNLVPLRISGMEVANLNESSHLWSMCLYGHLCKWHFFNCSNVSHWFTLDNSNCTAYRVEQQTKFSMLAKIDYSGGEQGVIYETAEHTTSSNICAFFCLHAKCSRFVFDSNLHKCRLA